MPRNGSGTFNLVSGNPVVTGTTIESNWANTTLSDIATTLTDSLSRSGQGGMTAALRIADGSQGAPGVGFANETGSGFYRAGTGEVWAVVQGSQTLRLDANGVYVPADKSTTVDGAFVFNEAGADKDARFEGDTDANLLFTDASTDRVGIGTATPAVKLDVVGAASVSGNLAVDTNTLFVDATNNRVGVGTVTPAVSLDVNGGISIQSANNLTWGGAYGATTPAISASAGFLAFYPNGSTSGEQMRLTSTSLGLGTSSPTFGSGTGVEIERAGIATLRLENSSASNSFELYADTAANGINLRGRDSSPMNFWTGNTLRATLDSSGNLGLGVTPSAWTIKASQVLTSSLSSDGNDAYLTANGFFDGSWKYVASDFAAQYYQVNGVHVWRTAPSGTAGNAISFTQAMTLDASGNLLVNRTAVVGLEKLSVNGGARLETFADIIGGAGTPELRLYQNTNNWSIRNSAGALAFYDLTGSAERARITSGGYFKASNTGTYAGSTASYHEFYQTNNSDTVRLTNTSTAVSGAYGLYVDLTVDPNATDSFFVRCFGGATQRASIRSNGGLANYSANNVNLSDRREKTNFAPAKSYLDTICAIPVQTFEYIDQSEDDPGLTLGVVAQDVQAVAPELVMESNWGTADEPKQRLSIYQTDLQYALMKCIQEQQALITDLRARVEALESN